MTEERRKKIVEATAATLGMTSAEFVGKGRRATWARSVTMCVMRYADDATISEIARVMGYRSCEAVRLAVENVRTKMCVDDDLERQVGAIIGMIR